MTIPMPEPVAWRSKYKSEPGMIGQYPWSYVERSLRQPSLNNYDIEALITTTQAEAYAAAKVREALEKAASLCDELANNDENSGEYAGCAAHSAARIRALIPKDQA